MTRRAQSLIQLRVMFSGTDPNTPHPATILTVRRPPSRAGALQKIVGHWSAAETELEGEKPRLAALPLLMALHICETPILQIIAGKLDLKLCESFNEARSSQGR